MEVGMSYHTLGASKYDVGKNFRCFDPLPPCHCHKSADFVPFVFIFGDPLPLTHCGRHLWKPPWILPYIEQ